MVPLGGSAAEGKCKSVAAANPTHSSEMGCLHHRTRVFPINAAAHGVTGLGTDPAQRSVQIPRTDRPILWSNYGVNK